MGKKNGHWNIHWRWLLILIAIAFTTIIIYSNRLIKNMAQEERRRIAIWADAISYKAQFVNETERFFNSIREGEGNRAKLLAQAIKKVNEASFDEDITFYQDIISSNATVPTIITDAKGEINAAVNVPQSIIDAKNINEIRQETGDFDSLKIQYYKQDYIVVYYKESKIYSNLHTVIDNLMQSFFQETVINSASVPVIITDSTERVVLRSGNIDTALLKDSEALYAKLDKMKNGNPPIAVDLLDQGKCYVFYEESSVLKQLRFFPFLQFIITLLFVLGAYMLLRVSRRSEQNQLWVGMSKETAHQLGTPISSLMAWTELLKDMPVDPSVTAEIGKDVSRLETIAQRFSKIGSVPELLPTDLVAVISGFTQYLQHRVPSMVTVVFEKPETEKIVLPLNRPLFEWVIENLCKNAVDAMEGKGRIVIHISEDHKTVCIDIADSGKGMSGKMQKDIFKPGITSKSRGWGLGLTLACRIINEYHRGRLYVKSSAPDQGTVMRIELRR